MRRTKGPLLTLVNRFALQLKIESEGAEVPVVGWKRAGGQLQQTGNAQICQTLLILWSWLCSILSILTFSPETAVKRHANNYLVDNKKLNPIRQAHGIMPALRNTRS
jgi:hypothetical protein